jgi:fatty acid desaturase
MIWAFGLFPLVPVLALIEPRLAPWLLPIGLYAAYAAGVLTHNHNHCPVFTGKRSNAIYSAWLSVFYGFPIFAWVPTHNQNHHRYTDRVGDITRTTRRSSNNTFLGALTYPLWCSLVQAPVIWRYAVDARESHPERYRNIVIQTLALCTAHVGLLGVAVALHGAHTGLWVYVLSAGIPALSGTWSMMFTNYMQHVECDVGSPHDHSRNFTNPVWNWLCFDNGFHTVHHDRPGEHWSRYAELHRARGGSLDPRLNESTIVSYCVKRYLLGRAPQHASSQPLPGSPLDDSSWLGG